MLIRCSYFVTFSFYFFPLLIGSLYKVLKNCLMVTKLVKKSKKLESNEHWMSKKWEKSVHGFILCLFVFPFAFRYNVKLKLRGGVKVLSLMRIHTYSLIVSGFLKSWLSWRSTRKKVFALVVPLDPLSAASIPRGSFCWLLFILLCVCSVLLHNLHQPHHQLRAGAPHTPHILGGCTTR